MKTALISLLAASALFVAGTAQAGPIIRARSVTYYNPGVSYVTPYVYTAPITTVYVDPVPVTYGYPVYTYSTYGRVYHSPYVYSGYTRGRR